MHNFRRTVREVVYIVKVTNHTIQNRLQEFKFTESSNMSVEDFLKQDFLESSHDPPSFYRNTEEYKKLTEEKGRKRKRVTAADDEEQTGEGSNTGQSDTGPQQRKAVEAGADLSKEPAINYTRDADGFIVPPLPSQIPRDIPRDESNDVGEGENTESLDRLAHEFGDEIDKQVDQSLDPQSKGKDRRTQLPINEEWVQDEEELEGQIHEIFNDPLTLEHTRAYTNASQRATVHTHWALQQRPQRQVSMSAEINEDEFADDLEVMNCLLSPEEARIKETIWVNQNKEWLRSHQEKVFRRKVEAERPKQTRKRRKRARMGEGQTSPASSAAEAAINVAKDRAWSKRINYDAIRSIFDIPNSGGLGSAATSRKTSLAGSTLGVEEEDGGGDDEAPEESVGGEDVEEDFAEQEGHGEYGGEEFGGGGEFEGGYEDDDNPDMDAEYGLDEFA